ncbi:hypothetical protein OJ996_02345 [Luteolibacter sp. GHJ8]|uniref:Bacterial repeat domain-containing protein n=1 Tax=Luteolibacter rhizosphaerae TaxID=2989719 RepID=A0ABT3FXU1_9BACT|nr:hypothetical protein [Luteolibacter rhizosphaerae]MCW1912394.1 hypothetical protein [Luteolibacter rhizosphaerae]
MNRLTLSLLALPLWALPTGLRAASDITISTAATSGGALSGTNPKAFTASAATANLQVSALQTELNAGTGVTVDTASAFSGNGDLTISNAVTKNSGALSPLALTAARDISISGALSASGGAMPLTLNAGRNITSTQGITTNGGAVVLAPTGEFVIGGTLNAGAGSVTLQKGTLRSATSQTISTAGGMTVTAGASLRLHGAVTGPLSVAGSVSPAAPGATGSLQVSGIFSLQPGSSTSIEIGGTSMGSNYDKITATGAVNVAGTLSVDLVNNFHDMIATSNSFTILQGSSIGGTFTGLPNGSRYTLPNDRGSFRVNYTATTVVLDDWQPTVTVLAWDPGTAEAGTEVFSNTNTRAGRHFFKVTTQSSDIGGWRSRLTVTSGEAALYFSKTILPTTSSSTHSSVQTGSDGLVLRDDQFAANEEWTLMVFATEGAQWNLVSGKPYVHDLGALPFTDANSNGQYDIGEAVSAQNAPAAPMPPEGIRFYKSVLPTGTPGWSLWLNGSNREIALRSNKLPFHNHTNNYTRKQAGRMLAVAPVIGSTGSTWYSSIVAPAGELVGLDSRIQFVSDLAYNGTVSNVAVTGAPYRVFRVQVPVDQIAWDINAVAVTGNPDIAVRKGNVPAEFDNEAFSATAGSATEGITLVPNYLTDGTWYITAWGDAPYTFTLKNGDPVITPLSFTDTKVNDQPARAGWRFYALTDIPSQVGALGWELQLANHVPGTQIALRRNKVPGRWQKRVDGGAGVTDTNSAYMDDSSTNGFVQRMNHQADVWYVGIFLPQQALGAFNLDVHPITPATIPFQTSTAVGPIPAQKWHYYRMDIGSGMLGWDLRLKNATGGNCSLVVRRDQLPSTTGTNTGGTTPWSPSSGTSWASGYQITGSNDWTGRPYDVTGTARREMNDRLLLGAGRPLVPGTYYIGIYNDGSDPVAGTSGQTASMTLESRGIGAGLDIPVGSLGLATGSGVTVSNLAPREAAYYKVSIPENTPSWEFTLDQGPGESAVVARRGAIPDFNAVYNGDVQDTSNNSTRQVKVQRSGSERYLLLPLNNQPALLAGDYYIGVLSEGLNPPASNVVGSAPGSATLTSRGPLAIQDLGAASTSGITQQISLSGAQVKAYQFTVPVGTAALEVRLDNRAGNPQLAMISGTKIPQPDASAHDYGIAGGQTAAPSGGMGRVTTGSLLNIANPVAGIYTLTVRAEDLNSVYPDASANLVIMANGPVPMDFNDTEIVSNHTSAAWRYFQVTVPDGVMGWDLRLTNILSGNPQMVIRRDQLPSVLGTNVGNSTPWNPSTETTWPSGYQWTGGVDWTGRGFDTSTSPRRGVGERVFAAMGRPLTPGTYIVGVFNQGTDPLTGTANTPASYSIESRGVGAGQPIGVGEIPFVIGGATTVNELPRREAAYFKITIPPNTPRWEFNLNPTAGEAMMIVRRGYLPDFNAAEGGDVQDTGSGSRQVEMQRTGMERYLLLPQNNQDSILPGDYYLAVIAEGVNPPGSTVTGTGTSSATFTIQQPINAADLGTVSTAGSTQAVALAAAETKAYQFTVPAGTLSMEIGLDNKIGNPVLAIISGTKIPQPDSSAQDYGVAGGQSSAPAGGGMSRQSISGLQTFTNPPPGVYTATVRADDVANPATADFVIRANVPQDLPLGGGSTVVTNHGPNSWKYFRVEVPADIAGWDLRIKDITGGDVSWAVRRDQIPANTGTNTGGTTPWSPSATSSWPSGNQWAGGKDWTERGYDTTVSARREMNDRLVMAMGRPLEAGTYFIGVLNGGSDPIGGGSNQMSSYTIESRFIGNGKAIPIRTLDYVAGSSVPVNNLAPREAAYYKLSIPANTPSWEFTFAPISGETMVAARQGFIPDFNAAAGGNLQDASTSRQIKVQKAGAERYLLLPSNNEDKILAGDYYIAVVSEGVNPPNSTVIGSGSSSGTLASNGSPAVTNLGTASLTPINHAVSLSGAQVKGYQFTVPEGVVSLELQLNNRTGNPRMALISGNRLPFPDSSVNEFGIGGGQSTTPAEGFARTLADSLITVPNPPPGVYSLTVRADDLSSVYPDATGDLVIVARPRTALNFASSQNGNGLSHSDTKQLADGQKQFYEIAVPATLSNQAVIGWILKVNHAQGDTTLRVYKTWGNTSTGIQVTGNAALIVPPFLTFNETWFVEVTATGLTNYTLTSRPVTLERPAWQMPTGHNFTFGDSGNDSSGNPLPGDRGVDIGQDDWHVYAIDVPQRNSGLLRTELRAISGNPDLYIREDGVPTTDHDANGGETGGASLVHREMKDSGSEYGNWVPVDGRAERQLRPGRWYLGVKAAGGSNARYRLLASTGNVTDLELSGASVTNQTLIGRDSRYYRFTVPVDAPATWNLGFTQQVGDVVMWVRDAVPSGQNSGTSSANSSIESWVDDAKNQGPYLAGGYDAPQIYGLNTPPLRPGHTYYAGFRATSDATFSLTSNITGNAPVATPVSFYNGVIDTAIPAGGNVLYKIAAPAEGTRLKWTSTHPATVQLRVEQGTIPGLSGTQHSNSSTANSTMNQVLTATGWPWQSAQTYYLRIVNNGAAQANVLVNVAGVNAGTEDEDNDGLLDAWERKYFNSLTHNGAADPDGDGVSNLVEQTDGTVPNDINSAKYFLNVNANFGSVTKAPNLPKYDRGTQVTLTPTPNPGLIFTGWSVGATGTSNPLQFAIMADRNITANFGVSLPVALDTPLAITTGGDGIWLGQTVTSMDGTDAAQSAPIGNNQQAWMETTVNGPGEMAFAWKVSSQSGDYLEFHVDGVLKTGRITGEVDWQLKSYAIDPGQHVLRWRYVKNGAGTAGADSAWVDAVNWMPAGGYNQWVSTNFTPQEIANPLIVGQDADPDRDGVANLIEYAFGTNPKGTGDMGMGRLTPEVVEVAGKKRLRLRFTLPEFVPADVLYEVQVTNDLGNWTVIADQQGTTGWNGAASTGIGQPVDGRREHLITDDATLPPTTKRLGRVKVSLQ